MEEDIPKILKTLTASRNKQSIYQNLSSLRHLVTNKRQFAIVLKNGGIRGITGSLRSFPNNGPIVNVALSILGNCCIERDCAKEVIKHNGIQILSDILKSWTSDSIICRIFRIIGNIAQFDNYASEIYKFGIVPIVVKVLNNAALKHEIDHEERQNKEADRKISLGTQDTAVRLLRMLWNSYSNRENMTQDGAIRAVSLILTKHTDKWSKKEYPAVMRKEIQKFLGNVLKTVHLFSKLGSAECAKQILADGNGFKTLVTLIPLNPYLSVKSLTNLSHVATSRSDIANAEAVQCVVSKLREIMQRHSNDRCPTELVGAFCLFFKHPLNCSEVKKAGGLELLLELLKKCTSKRQESLMVYALYIFNYDSQGQEILKSNGVVKIAIDCIEKNLKCKQDLSEAHTYVKMCIRRSTSTDSAPSTSYSKRKCLRNRSPSEESSSSSSSRPGFSSSARLLEFISGRITPPDSDSSPISSPSCTPPRNSEYDLEDSDNSGNYSPVCSDMEDNEDEEKTRLEKSDEFEEESEKESDHENNIMSVNIVDGEEKIIYMMLCLLSRLIYIKPTSAENNLASKRDITVLFKYLRECKRSTEKIQLLLGNIVSDPDNLNSLIQDDVIKLIYSLVDQQHDLNCKICSKICTTAKALLKQISSVSEDNFAKITDIISYGNDEEKLQCIIIVPYIVRKRSMLLRIMDRLNGLNTLIVSFTDNSEHRFDISISLNKLSRLIQINSPLVNIFSKKFYNLGERYEFNPEGKQIVTIELDDGTSLDVDRDFLIEKVDYFKMMLTGSFCESNQEVIRLKNVSNEALQCLLNLLKIDYQKMVPPPLNVNLLTLLEVLALTDLYLLEKLTDWLSTCVLNFFLKIETASEIYNWSITSGTNFLRVETVVFLLTAKMRDCERFNLLESIIEYGFINEIKDDIFRLISRYLTIR